ncbi:MAG TPA: transketolase C-terminal domain-containing protein [Candidatus Binatia bacterium]|nr:transketolase C-terminal domain-containing protein [Candidatus Binatia bacterium]
MAEPRSLREAFGRALVEVGRRRDDFVVLDADVAGGTGTVHFKQAFPDRFYDFGIAEQNMMAAAAGIAATGVIPVVTTFAVFATMRALEQLRTFVAYPRFPVKVAGSHCGVDAGPDGATAQALEDLAITRAIPALAVVVPADPVEMAAAVDAILAHPGPVYLRTGRSPLPVLFGADHRFAVGRAQVLEEGSDVTLVACGTMVHRTIAAATALRREGIRARVVNCPTLKPLDVECLVASAERTGAVVTAEDHSVIGGLGGAVAEALAERCPVPVARVGVRDRFGASGDPLVLAQHFGLGAEDVAAAARRLVRAKERRRVA